MNTKHISPITQKTNFRERYTEAEIFNKQLLLKVMYNKHKTHYHRDTIDKSSLIFGNKKKIAAYNYFESLGCRKALTTTSPVL